VGSELGAERASALSCCQRPFPHRTRDRKWSRQLAWCVLKDIPAAASGLPPGNRRYRFVVGRSWGNWKGQRSGTRCERSTLPLSPPCGREDRNARLSASPVSSGVLSGVLSGTRRSPDTGDISALPCLAHVGPVIAWLFSCALLVLLESAQREHGSCYAKDFDAPGPLRPMPQAPWSSWEHVVFCPSPRWGRVVAPTSRDGHRDPALRRARLPRGPSRQPPSLHTQRQRAGASSGAPNHQTPATANLLHARQPLASSVLRIGRLSSGRLQPFAPNSRRHSGKSAGRRVSEGLEPASLLVERPVPCVHQRA